MFKSQSQYEQCRGTERTCVANGVSGRDFYCVKDKQSVAHSGPAQCFRPRFTSRAHRATCQAGFDVSSSADIMGQADAVAIAYFYHFTAATSNDS